MLVNGYGADVIIGTLDGNYTYTSYDANNVIVNFGGAEPVGILEFEWLFATNATDTSGNGYDGTIIGATRNIATNGMSANYDLANATNSISATMGNVIQSLTWWGNTNGTWRYYEWIGGTQRVNNAAESYSTNEWFEVVGNDFAFTGSDFDVAQARGYNEVIANEVGVTNRTELGANLNIISDYLADDTNTYWHGTYLYVGHNNILQDGSPNGRDLTTTSSPDLDLKSTTRNGAGDYNGTANYVNCTNASMHGVDTLLVSAWVRRDAGFAVGRFVSKDETGEAGCWLFQIIANQVQFVLPSDGAKTITDPSSTTLTDNNWHHCAATLDGTAMRLYVDGVKVATNTWDGSLNDALNKNIFIGSDSDISAPSAFWNGGIDEVMITTNAWTDAQATNYYDATTNLYY